ncbi:NAD(P)-binding protein [Aspergillus cavernicola]|uniref:NAD(P)-binding protein n=1 Tax=Aspergillus cavernicola TaxID=176166 RepID=A0ABR4HKL3_9EURO
MSPPKIFLTGASGYVGGDILHAILSAHPDWESSITVLLRNHSYEAPFRAKYPHLNLFFATYDNTAAIEAEVAKNELVVHFALSADHLPSATAIVKGLEKRGGGIYIHTSGTDVLLDPRAPLHTPSTGVRVINDWDGLAELTSLPDDASHREIDKFVLASGSETLKTAIICPSTIYGPGRGPISQRSDQIPGLARLILQTGKGLQLADGKTFWNSVHIYDLARLYISLIEDAISSPGGGGKATWNAEGYYLVESGTYFWGEISRRITKEAYALGLVKEEEVTVVDIKSRDVMAPAGLPVGNYAVKGKAVRARELLGWSPVEGSLEDEVPVIVRAEAKARGL